jgi:hypothetical protein
MPPQDTVTLALAFLATLILIRLLLPNVLVVLGLLDLRNGFAGGPEDANCYWPSRTDADLYQEMLALGFRPEGTYWEQLPFTRRFEEFVFTRPGEKCFGLLYPNDQIMPRRGAFLTVFETGGVVFTKNYSGGVEIQEGDFLATGARTGPAPPPQPEPPAPARSPWKPLVFFLMAGLLYVGAEAGGPGRRPGSDRRVLLGVLGGLAVIGTLTALATLPRNRPRVAAPPPERDPADLDLRVSLAETLTRHRLNVNRSIAEGQQLPPSFDAGEFIATQHRYHRHPRLRRQFRSTMGFLLLSKLTVLAPLPAIAFYTRGVHDPLPWGVLLAEGLMGLYLRYGCSSAAVVTILRGGVRCDGARKNSGE